MAHLFDQELVADQIRRVALHLAQALFEDAGAGAGAGLTTEGANGGTLAGIQGRLLAQLVELFHRRGAARLGGAGRRRHARLLRGALTGAAALRGAILLTGALLAFTLPRLLGLALSLLLRFRCLTLASLGLWLGLTPANIFGLTLPLPPGSGLLLVLLARFGLRLWLFFSTATGLRLLLLRTAIGLRGLLWRSFGALSLARLVLGGLLRLRFLPLLGLSVRLLRLGTTLSGLCLVRLTAFGLLLGGRFARLGLFRLRFAGAGPFLLAGCAAGGGFLLLTLAGLALLALLAGLTLGGFLVSGLLARGFR